ncbi:MAG: hypothetical protein J2P23_00590 [Microlunatus sp.]|nr:hypothetical protein [Microlunatus sp.]
MVVITTPPRAFACPTKKAQDGVGRKSIAIRCDAKDDKTDDSRRRKSKNDGHPIVGSEPHVKTYAEIVAEIRKRNAAATQAYIAAIKQRNDHFRTGECVFSAGGSFSGTDCSVNKPKLIKIPKPPKGAPAPPPISPEEAAYQAIATKLQINASGVGIGPDPDLSRWNMAVVGHSYWMWATGPTHLGPVSDSASGRTVTLVADLTTTVFDMGDGNTLTCNGPGTPYPGDDKGLYARSPTCGYTYFTTSEHRGGGVYHVRVTSYWTVAYSAPDGSGTIPIVLSSERDLRVGELQTVVTR